MDFSFGKLSLRATKQVYPPSDDSFMLAENSRKLKGRILDMGTGCGIAALVNASENPENEVLGVDINREALSCARKNAEKNGIKNARFSESNLFSGIETEKFDCILFNPPYLPTAEKEKLDGGINAAFDGGKDGRKTLDLFLEKASRHLFEKGRILLVQSSLNNPERTVEMLRKKSFEVETIEKRSFFFEKLFLYRAILKK